MTTFFQPVQDCPASYTCVIHKGAEKGRVGVVVGEGGDLK